MLRILIVLLALIPLFDLMILVIINRQIGLPATVALVVLTALVGLMLARFAGRRNLRRIETAIRAGDVPTDHVLDGAIILAAGLLLLTPGIVTDIVALGGLFGPTRTPMRNGLKRWLIVPYLDRKTGGFVTGEVYVGGFPGQQPRADAVEVDIDIEDIGEESDRESKP